LHVPQQVKESIDSAIEATQRAVEAQNKAAPSTAEAQQRIAEANGIAQSTMIRAQADANQLLNSSLTPMLIQYEALQKWNGTLPQVTPIHQCGFATRRRLATTLNENRFFISDLQNR
jgi:regulator of protease activity HflC (stomatin/prohibitin superfamily)